MNDEEIEIEIGADGKVVVRTIGIKGPRAWTSPKRSPRSSAARNRAS